MELGLVMNKTSLDDKMVGPNLGHFNFGKNISKSFSCLDKSFFPKILVFAKGIFPTFEPP